MVVAAPLVATSAPAALLVVRARLARRVVVLLVVVGLLTLLRHAAPPCPGAVHGRHFHVAEVRRKRQDWLDLLLCRARPLVHLEAEPSLVPRHGLSRERAGEVRRRPRRHIDSKLSLPTRLQARPLRRPHVSPRLRPLRLERFAKVLDEALLGGDGHALAVRRTLTTEESQPLLRVLDDPRVDEVGGDDRARAPLSRLAVNCHHIFRVGLQPRMNVRAALLELWHLGRVVIVERDVRHAPVECSGVVDALRAQIVELVVPCVRRLEVV
mmetsp:Transcript_17023/g.39854  ORF Transcript_17023/g.39854 Transcript_17023/m.39854 type:complete len:268 (-) Transcript_17023:513-1316(-)